MEGGSAGGQRWPTALPARMALQCLNPTHTCLNPHSYLGQPQPTPLSSLPLPPACLPGPLFFDFRSHMVLVHCTAPTLEPVFELVVRHLLGPRWEAAAEEDKEAARAQAEAAFLELMEREEEEQEGAKVGGPLGEQVWRWGLTERVVQRA